LVSEALWICPACRGALAPGPSRWDCRGCGLAYDAWRGIPDLRTREDGFLDNEADRAFAARLLEDYDRLDFEGLLDRHFDLCPEIPDALRRRQIAHIQTAPDRARHWRTAMGNAGGPWLDLGCGTESFLAAEGRTAPAPGPLGVDIALRWLLLARKRLDEEGLSAIPLACACAEDLPLADGALGGIVAGDVIEHVADQSATLAEAHRTLREGGRLFLASPNRFSMAPEPHVQVWGVGFLPRSWMPGYVRWRRGVEFKAIRTLGAGEWSRLLRSSPFGGGGLVVPPLPDGDLSRFGPVKRWLATRHNRIVSHPPGQWLGRRIGPLFHVTCEKRSPVGRTPIAPIPAIPRRSRPSEAPR
jgi:SAM-dependent methyltransferase